MELVAPAGNLDKLYYAYTYGADAAYIGLKRFSLRVKADNFYENEYREIIKLKESHPKKRLFCALNISFHNRDIDNFLSDLDFFRCYPIDSFIIQDIGMVPILQKHFPAAALHLSTQANCINREAVKMYRNLGFKRVVLGREASLEEIRQIKDAVPEMELEVFAHGAMCIAYSGRCLMSAYLTGRSANGGFCSHSCRWEYNVLSNLPKNGQLVLEEKERPGEYFPVFEGENFTAVLSSKDLCMIDHLDKMKAAGVDSLKIEGRMKSIYYVALTTRAYRKALDALEGKITMQESRPFVDELYNASHREFGTGFFFGQDDANKTTTGASDSPYELCASIGSVLDSVCESNVFRNAQNTENLRNQEMLEMHPAARAAKEADFAAHPEKRKPLVERHSDWHFYVYNAMNKVASADSGVSNASWVLEFISPDIPCLAAPENSYQLINPETGEVLDWVCHGHPCLIYTNLPLSEGMLVRTKNIRFGQVQGR